MSFSGPFGGAKFPGKYSILPEVIKFCLTSELFLKLDGICQDGEAKILEAPGAGIRPFSLEQSAQYRLYIDQFESDFEAFLVSHRSSVEKFFSICQDVEKFDKSGSFQGFLDLIIKITDFETFADLVSSKEKRVYIKQILGMYANWLGLKGPPKEIPTKQEKNKEEEKNKK